VQKTETQAQTDGATSKLQAMAGRFAPTEISADLSRLTPADRQVLAKLVQASKIIDALFMRQVWAGNEAMLLDLVRDLRLDAHGHNVFPRSFRPPPRPPSRAV